MASSVNPIPDGYRSVTPYLVVDGAAKLIDFMKQAFGAQEISRASRPDGSVGHAEIRIGDSLVMVGQPTDPSNATPSSLYLYVTDTDAVYRKALDAGASSLMEPADQFYGDRNAGIRDPSGNSWWIATHIEDVDPEEMRRRAASAGYT